MRWAAAGCSQIAPTMFFPPIPPPSLPSVSNSSFVVVELSGTGAIKIEGCGNRGIARNLKMKWIGSKQVNLDTIPDGQAIDQI